MLAPAFKPALFPYYFRRVAERTYELWSIAQNRVASGKKVKLEPLFREHYFGITIEMSTGVNVNSDLSAHLRELFSTVQRGLFSPPFRPMWSKDVRASAEIKSILAYIIRDSIVNRASTIEKLRLYGDDIVKLGTLMYFWWLLPALSFPPKLSEQMLLLWFPGYATAAVTSANAFFEMGWDDNARASLYREQDELIQAAGDERAATYDQTSSMPILEAYIMESLRLRPAGNGVFRRVTRDIEVHGKLLPKDTVVFASFK